MGVNNEVEILLVEDNPNDAELTMRALKKAHFANRLVWVKDGAAALEMLFGAEAIRRQRVVLLDLKLPKIDSVDVLRRIKEVPQLRTTPVVVLTSSREEPDIARCYELGANSYIVKPVDFEKFSEAVRQLGLYWLLINQTP